MTTTEINHYIYTKQIPLSFIWEDGLEYYITIFNGEEITSVSYNNSSEFTYPNWCQYMTLPQIRFGLRGETKQIYRKQAKTFDDFKTVLTDFLFWWELNKSRCSQITYYQI